MNGFDLLRAIIKADETLAHLPVPMVTAEARREDIVMAVAAPPATSSSPFTKATLEEKISVNKILQSLPSWPEAAMQMNDLSVAAPGCARGLRQLGLLTRQLHDALTQLGLMPGLQRSAADLPGCPRPA